MQVFFSIKDLVYIFYPGIRTVTLNTLEDPGVQVLFLTKKSDTRTVKIIESRFSNLIVMLSFPVHGIDLCLQTREDYLDYVSDKYKYKVSKRMYKAVGYLNDDDFTVFIKKSIFTGGWYTTFLESRQKMYKLFQVMTSSKKEFLKTYSELCQHNTPEAVFSSMLTFVSRLQGYEKQKETLSEFYREILRAAKVQSGSIKTHLEVLVKLSPKIPIENKYLWFYLSMRS